MVEEHYIRDDSWLVGACNGKPHVTWFITDQGIWRKDPKGPGLLRYLPPALADGLAWKQKSGDTDVWFRLQAVSPCESHRGPTFEECWQLTVLNRREQTVFRFAPGPTPPPFIGDMSGVIEGAWTTTPIPLNPTSS